MPKTEAYDLLTRVLVHQSLDCHPEPREGGGGTEADDMCHSLRIVCLQHGNQIHRKARVHGVLDGEAFEVHNPHERLHRPAHVLAADLQQPDEVVQKCLGLSTLAGSKATVNARSTKVVETNEACVVIPVVLLACSALNLRGPCLLPPLESGGNALCCTFRVALFSTNIARNAVIIDEVAFQCNQIFVLCSWAETEYIWTVYQVQRHLHTGMRVWVLALV